MSLSAREQQALDSIKEGLARSDPRLAALLATFTRLVCDEEMPAREKIRASSWRAASRRRRRPRSKSHRHARPIDQRPGFQRVALLVYVLIMVALIVTGVALGRSGGHNQCPSPWAVPCASSAPARGSRTAPHKEPASQARDQQVRVWHSDELGSRG